MHNPPRCVLKLFIAVTSWACDGIFPDMQLCKTFCLPVHFVQELNVFTVWGESL